MAPSGFITSQHTALRKVLPVAPAAQTAQAAQLMDRVRLIGTSRPGCNGPQPPAVAGDGAAGTAIPLAIQEAIMAVPPARLCRGRAGQAILVLVASTSGGVVNDIYVTGLEANAANYAPLTPLTFLDWSADVYPEHLAVVHGARRFTWAQTRAVPRLASALSARGSATGTRCR